MLFCNNIVCLITTHANPRLQLSRVLNIPFLMIVCVGIRSHIPEVKNGQNSYLGLGLL